MSKATRKAVKDRVKRTAKLGMFPGTATKRLNRQLLFNFAERLGLTNCFRCNTKIESLGEFSIDHKESWMTADNPVQMFFDLQNIAFSHLTCNYRAPGEATRIYTDARAQKRAHKRRQQAARRLKLEAL